VKTGSHPVLEATAADILALVGDGVVSTDENGCIILFNRAAEEMFGYTFEEVLGRDVELLIPSRFRARHTDEAQRFASGVSATQRIMGHRREVTGLRRDGVEFPAEATLSRRKLAGRTTLTAVIRDISERHELDERRRLLSAELGHRMKNVMALVQAVVRLSSREADSLETYRDALQGRLEAIARAQDRLVERRSGGATLLEQLRAELDSYENAQQTNIRLDGPPVTLDAQLGVSLGLVLHELTTNAAKYGALSTPGGRIEVTWSISDDAPRRVRLAWRETGGPPVTRPTRRGFGTTLIERSLANNKGYRADLRYLPEGLLCEIELPLGA
jgi:PAS domain S-box-containing protein